MLLNKPQAISLGGAVYRLPLPPAARRGLSAGLVNASGEGEVAGGLSRVRTLSRLGTRTGGVLGLQRAARDCMQRCRSKRQIGSREGKAHRSGLWPLDRRRSRFMLDDPRASIFCWIIRRCGQPGVRSGPSCKGRDCGGPSQRARVTPPAGLTPKSSRPLTNSLKPTAEPIPADSADPGSGQAPSAGHHRRPPKFDLASLRCATVHIFISRVTPDPR